MAMSDQTPLVAGIKADLEARGVPLAGACGAFEITHRVAWALKAGGAGLHADTTGEHCRGYDPNIVMWPDGSYADCLIDAGGRNTPAWQVRQGDPAFYRPPVDPGEAVPAPPPPLDPPLPLDPFPDVLTGLDVLRQGLVFVERLVAAVELDARAALATSETLATIQRDGVKVRT